jgi:iron complex outermembrane receptor protein
MFQRTKICTGLLLAFGSVAAFAQDAAPAVQRVEITGSSIKRVDAETALPIQTITREDIAKTGATSTEQLLQNVSANSSAGAINSAQNAGQATYGLSSASLRGLGANRTLVLVNGRRLANYATDGTTVDINSIPISAIDRVEVLKDGASGVYGSDAVAGVINFILRKDFKGVEINGTYGQPTHSGGGHTTKYGIVFGIGDIDTDHVSFMASLDIAKDTAIYGSQRSYANKSWADDGLFDESATATGAIRTYDPNIVNTHNQGSGLYADGSGVGNVLGPTSPSSTTNNCTANGMSYDVNYNTCRYNPSPFVPLTPDQTRVNGALNLRGRINQDNDFFVEAFVSHTKTVIQEQASPYSVSFLATDGAFQRAGVNPAIVINSSSPYYPAAYINAVNTVNAAYNAAHPDSPQKVILPANAPVTVSYRALDAGARVHTDEADQYHFASGFTGTVKGWDYDATYAHNESIVSESTQNGYQSQLALVQLLSGNDAFNPFAAAQTPELAAQIRATNYVGNMIHSSLSTDSVDLKASREVATLPGGPLQVAVGVTFRKENLDLRPSAAYQTGDISGYGGAVLPFNVSRNSHSIFGEIDAPILKSLEADLSVRNDHYPDASSTNPKLSLKFVPIQQVLLRGSVGTGFRIASLPELYTPLAQGTTAIFTDPVTHTPGQFTQLLGGNPDLVPEKSRQGSVGIVLEPMKGLSASFDYYHIRIKNDITGLDPEFVVKAAALGNPAYTGLVERDETGNITQITTKNVNVGGIVTAGVDVDVKWQSLKSAAGQFGVELVGTYIQKYDETTVDGSVQKSVGRTTDTNDSPINAITNGGIILRWKHELTGTWNYGPYGLAVTQNLQSGYKDAPRAAYDCDPDDYDAPDAPPAECSTGRKVGSFSTWDLQAQYTGIKNLTFRLGVKNIGDRKPPRVTTNGTYFQAGYDPTYYDPHGRFVYTQGSYTF